MNGWSVPLGVGAVCVHKQLWLWDLVDCECVLGLHTRMRVRAGVVGILNRTRGEAVPAGDRHVMVLPTLPKFRNAVDDIMTLATGHKHSKPLVVATDIAHDKTIVPDDGLLDQVRQIVPR
ncbi:Aste57867_8483 [Aphanomyces stellatus]|uniref:Aste57867_8483 protein n=1 Tax=Aphanomyces stellatus TaxID=120398 RepID=A0A485KKD4_9STRA|nr:hypothetical protein As57867_008451 [Aphanomyces stellatus]VFT85369.1 Aste57867_8483 [Aphanomyces stellatus]